MLTNLKQFNKIECSFRHTPTYKRNTILLIGNVTIRTAPARDKTLFLASPTGSS